MSSEVIWKQKAQQRLHNITPWENWPSSCTELKGHSPSSSAASPTETWEITSMLVYRRLTFDGAFLRTVDISRGNHGIPNWAWEFLSQTWAAFKTRHYNDCRKMFIGNPSSSMTLPKKSPTITNQEKSLITYQMNNVKEEVSWWKETCHDN